MFDKLVESSSAGADLRPRRRIFAASFFFVAVLFATAVIASIYAAEFDLGNDNFDVAQLLTPIAETEPPIEQEPVPQQQAEQINPSQQTSRVMNILRVDENPITPTSISTERSRYLSRPEGAFILNPRGEDSNGPSPDSLSSNMPVGSTSSSISRPVLEAEPIDRDAPPPAPKIERSRPPVSGGVMTGKATNLPPPTYSAAAKAVGAQGIVSVQITVDEEGKVISARALDGNVMLRASAVAAAWKARFNPTTLTGKPVKVTGIITYNFRR